MSRFALKKDGRPEGRPLIHKSFTQCFNPRSRIHNEQQESINGMVHSKVFYSMKLTMLFSGNILCACIGNFGEKSGCYSPNSRPRGFGRFGLLR